MFECPNCGELGIEILLDSIRPCETNCLCCGVVFAWVPWELGDELMWVLVEVDDE